MSTRNQVTGHLLRRNWPVVTVTFFKVTGHIGVELNEMGQYVANPNVTAEPSANGPTVSDNGPQNSSTWGTKSKNPDNPAARSRPRMLDPAHTSRPRPKITTGLTHSVLDEIQVGFRDLEGEDLEIISQGSNIPSLLLSDYVECVDKPKLEVMDVNARLDLLLVQRDMMDMAGHLARGVATPAGAFYRSVNLVGKKSLMLPRQTLRRRHGRIVLARAIPHPKNRWDIDIVLSSCRLYPEGL
ncbi:hypothetical protein BD779DRAFT_1477226 [Infundibulicybe gibba]|nr:hypothetical protein BD779DRAFT_1477226 [Infundibulicybe gibba]